MEWERLAREAKAIIEGQRMDLKRCELALNRILLAETLESAKGSARSVLNVNKRLGKERVKKVNQ
jgi:hypothetical protein